MSDAKQPHRDPQLSSQPVMRGKGYYNAHSQMQYQSMKAGLPYLLKAAEKVPLPETGSAFVVADYGSSQGQNSLEPMRAVTQTIRRRSSKETPITVVHTDQPANDFSSLFKLVTSDKESYLQGDPNVFSYAVGRTFFDQVFPPHHVSLGWSVWAAMFLSSIPTAIPNHFHSSCITGVPHNAFANQAKRDWECFLLHRANELRHGGRLVLLFGGTDEHGHFGGEGLVNLANTTLQEMVQDGRLYSQEYGAMVMPVYFRTLSECAEPFSSGVIAAHLVLEESSLIVLPDPLWKEYEKTGDAEAFATEQSGFFRAWSETSLFGVLDVDRSPELRLQIADDFYQRVQEKITTSPTSAKCDWRMPCLLISKKNT